MKQRAWWHLVIAVAFVVSGSTPLRAGGFTDVTDLGTPTHDIRYTSGRTVYVEGLVDGQLIGRYWSAGGRINVPYELSGTKAGPPHGWSPTSWAGSDDGAFRLQIEGQWLASGWRWLGAREVERTEHGARHFVVELESTIRPIRVKVHTLLDGTPVLVRWLEITNTSQKATALTAVFPWSSRLWRAEDYRSTLTNPADPVFQLGYFTEVSHGWEGSFRWFPLKDQTTHIRYSDGTGANDPFFVVRNNAAGEYFIGHLAWTANWEMDFKSNQDTPDGGGMQGLSRECSEAS